MQALGKMRKCWEMLPLSLQAAMDSMQIQLVNHCKIGQGSQGQEAILLLHYADYLLLNMLKRNV